MVNDNKNNKKYKLKGFFIYIIKLNDFLFKIGKTWNLD
jgi:hypothetical protein